MALWTAQGEWQEFATLAEACALAAPSGSGAIWAGGRCDLAELGTPARQHLPPLRLDNHWIALRA